MLSRKSHMKHIFLSILVLISIVSCSEDFNLLAPKEEIPIVHGFLSQTDTAQYIRVQRAFRDQDVSAVDLAQSPDILYYADATVTITDLTTEKVYNLHRVNGNDEGYPKENGAFVSDPNYLYKIHTDEIELVSGRDYLLSINTQEDGNKIATSTITLGGIPNLTNPREDFDMSFTFESETVIAWREVENLELYDVNFYINYKERDATNSEADFVDKQLVWNVGRNIDEERFFILGLDFYTHILASLEVDPTIVRRLVNLECELVGGGQELADFINIGEANTGITSSGETPIYSNIENGLGFFSSRSTDKVSDIFITNRTLDSLQNSQLTVELNFQ